MSIVRKALYGKNYLEVKKDTVVLHYRNNEFLQGYAPGEHFIRNVNNYNKDEFLAIYTNVPIDLTYTSTKASAVGNWLYQLQVKIKVQITNYETIGALSTVQQLQELQNSLIKHLSNKVESIPEAIVKSGPTTKLQKNQLEELVTTQITSHTILPIKILALEILDFKAGLTVPAANQAAIVLNQTELKILPAGVHWFDFNNDIQLSMVPLSLNEKTVINQEVISKDNIALRFSYVISYQINSLSKLSGMFLADIDTLNSTIENYVYSASQLYVREQIGNFNAEELVGNKLQIINEAKQNLATKLDAFGITLFELAIKDLTFPKDIQDTFAILLQAQITSKAEMESARTQVAVARAKRNAADILKSDENTKYLMLLETLQKMSEKGRHTFNFDTTKLLEKVG